MWAWLTEGTYVEQSYYTGKVRTTGSGYTYAGDLAGNLEGEVRECYVAGSVEVTLDSNAPDATAGGFIGISSPNSIITRVAILSSSASAHLGLSTMSSGRVVGKPQNTTISEAYANSAMTINGNTVTGNQTDKNGESTDLSTLQQESFYTAPNMAWDFSNVWKMGLSYPEFIK